MFFSSAAIFAKDMAKMVDFYQKAGLALNWDGGDFVGVKMENGVFFNLCARRLMDPRGQLGYVDGVCGHTEINFGFHSVAEVDEAYARFLAAGASPLHPPVLQPYGIYESFVTDPEGNILELNYAVEE